MWMLMHSWHTKNCWHTTQVPLWLRLTLETSRATSPRSNLETADSAAPPQTSSLIYSSSSFSMRSSFRSPFLMSRNCCRCLGLWPLFLSFAMSRTLSTFCQLHLDAKFSMLDTLPYFSPLQPNMMMGCNTSRSV